VDAVSPEHAGDNAGRTPDLQTLCFLRWLADFGRLEDTPYSAPRGELSLLIRWLPNERGEYVVIA
jgi:hypothetical protein